MPNQKALEEEHVSNDLIQAGLNYLARSGVYEEPSLVLYKGFVQHMLETIVAESERGLISLTETSTLRTIDYFRRHFDPDEPSIIASPDFVQSLLSYGLLGIQTHDVAKRY